MERQIVLKALVGSHNYGLNTPESDKDYKVFVLPTFEELYFGKMYSKSIIGEAEDCDIHDVRKIINLFFKSNVNFLEVLFSKEIIIPEDYPEINQIVSMKKEIAKMNLPRLFDACNGMHTEKMKQLSKGTEGTQYLVDKFGYDTKQALHAYRILNFIVRFEATNFEDFEGAMKYDGEDLKFMLDIKNGFFTKDTFENFIEHYHDAIFIHLKEKYHSQPVNMELKEELERLIMQLVKKHIVRGVL